MNGMPLKLLQARGCVDNEIISSSVTQHTTLNHPCLPPRRSERDFEFRFLRSILGFEVVQPHLQITRHFGGWQWFGFPLRKSTIKRIWKSYPPNFIDCPHIPVHIVKGQFEKRASFGH